MRTYRETMAVEGFPIGAYLRRQGVTYETAANLLEIPVPRLRKYNEQQRMPFALYRRLVGTYGGNLPEPKTTKALRAWTLPKSYGWDRPPVPKALQAQVVESPRNGTGPVNAIPATPSGPVVREALRLVIAHMGELAQTVEQRTAQMQQAESRVRALEAEIAELTKQVDIANQVLSTEASPPTVGPHTEAAAELLRHVAPKDAHVEALVDRLPKSVQGQRLP